ncbi:hypothetical protein HK405_015457 [Cladochytrium tenue]|nr:hypothetical protein HK405_015457 [Cladochytrium tenue]
MQIEVPFADPLWLTRGTSPYYDDSHRRLQKEVREYVNTHLVPFCDEWEAQGFIPPEAFQRHAERGFHAVSIVPVLGQYLAGQRLPGDIDPRDWDGFHSLIVADEIHRCGYMGVLWGFGGGNSIGLAPIVHFGSEEQKQTYVRDVLTGKKRFCLGVTEPEAGSDVAGIKTTATRRGDVYIVNGSKKWITNGIWADHCTAVVRTGGEGIGGISVLIVPLNAKGVTRRRMQNSGVHASGSTYIEFDDVEVPVKNLIGKENQGFAIVMSNFNPERIGLATIALSLSRVCMRDAFLYATTRHTFGKPLLANQMIVAKLSHVGREIEAAHALLEQLVYLNKHAASPADAAALGGQIANLKVLCGNVLERAVREAQQVLGGAGYARGGTGRGARIEQISRDVRVIVVGGGSEEILSNLAVRQEVKALMQIKAKKKLAGKL